MRAAPALALLLLAACDAKPTCKPGVTTAAQAQVCEDRCAAGEASACWLAGVWYADPTFIESDGGPRNRPPRNESRGRDLFRRGCQLGDEASCRAVR